MPDTARRLLVVLLLALLAVGCHKGAPTTPLTPFADLFGDSLCFFTTATDPNGRDVRYVFDWDDGTSDTTAWHASGDTGHLGHTFDSAGTYSIRALAVNRDGRESGWSGALDFCWSRPPGISDTILGPGWYGINRWAWFRIVVNDPDQDSVAAKFIWGDGMSSSWSGLVAPGDTITDSVMYSNTGICTIEVVLRDRGNTISRPALKQVRLSEKALLWSTGIEEGYFFCSPTVGVLDGEVCIYGLDEEWGVKAYSSSGRLRWTSPLEFCDPCFCPSLSLDNSRLYVADEGSGLVCLDARTGVILWRADTLEPYSSPAVGPDGAVYVASYENDCLRRVLDKGDHAEVDWTLESHYYSGYGVSVNQDGTVYFLDDDGWHVRLSAIRSDGVILWRDSSTIGYSENLFPPIFDSQGHILVADDDGYLRCFTSDGELLWTCGELDPTTGSLVVGHDDQVFMQDWEGCLVSVRDGQRRWTEVSPGEGDENAPCITADSMVVVHNWYEDVVFAISENAQPGWELWLLDSLGIEERNRARRDDAEGSPSPILGPDGNLYFVSDWLGLCCVSLGNASLADTPWPTYLHDPARSGWAGRSPRR